MSAATSAATIRSAIKTFERKFPHPHVGCTHRGIFHRVSLADWAAAAGITPVYLGKLVNSITPRTSYQVVRDLAVVAGLSVEQVWVLITRNQTIKSRSRKGKKYA